MSQIPERGNKVQPEHYKPPEKIGGSSKFSVQEVHYHKSGKTEF